MKKRKNPRNRHNNTAVYIIHRILNWPNHGLPSCVFVTRPCEWNNLIFIHSTPVYYFQLSKKCNPRTNQLPLYRKTLPLKFFIFPVSDAMPFSRTRVPKKGLRFVYSLGYQLLNLKSWPAVKSVVTNLFVCCCKLIQILMHFPYAKLHLQKLISVANGSPL